jgi:hypothetical protein
METKRTIQNDIEKTRQNAARRTGNSDYEHVTPHDYRAFFATNMVLREGVDLEIVMELGGWEDRDTLDPYLEAAFGDIIADELAQAGVLDVDLDHPPTPLERIEQELTKLRTAVEEIDPSECRSRHRASRTL